MKTSDFSESFRPGAPVTHGAHTHRAAHRAMTAPIGAWLHQSMTIMFVFTGGAVGVLLVSFLVAEAQEAARMRRGRAILRR